MTGVTLKGFISSYQVASLPVVLALLIWSLAPRIKRWIQRYLKHREIYKKYLRPSIFDFDIIVIGAGAAGLAAAQIAASLKARVALIEKNKNGGADLYSGSVPSKALVRSARVAQIFRRGQEFGLHNVDPSVDFAKIFKRIQDVVKKVEPRSAPALCSEWGVQCFEGEAKLLDPFRVEIGGKIFTTRNIIIATGSEPLLPDTSGLQNVPYFTSETFWSLNEMPQRVLVLGGGSAGCELAQALTRLGCETTVVERREAILQKIDHDMSAVVLRRLEGEGLSVMTKTEITNLEKGVNGCKAQLAGGGQIAFDAVVLALGRRPVTRGLGLEDLGFVFRRDGTLETDEFMRTRFPNVFACGDVTGPFQMVHSGRHQAKHAVKNALFAPLRSFKTDYTALPSVTYVEPEVACVGWNETEAYAAGLIYDAHKFYLKDSDRAVCDGETDGVIKVLCEKVGGRILGATIVGPQAGEIIGEFVLAIRKKMNLQDILDTVHAYPTYFEANHSVARVWKNKLAPPWTMRAFEKFHIWRRGSDDYFQR